MVAFAGVVVVGSLLPDLDTPRSLAARAIPVVGPVTSWVLRRMSAAMYRLTRTRRDDDAEGTHRYLTHTIMFSLAVGTVVHIIGVMCGCWWIGLAVTLGCLTHLAGDWITVSGVPLLWPLSRRGKRWWRYRLPLTRIHAGGPFERWVIAPALAAAGFWPLWLILTAAG
jgi:membrane-bound metal-dependent hydrolase YbcI (DUF457 family)